MTKTRPPSLPQTRRLASPCSSHIAPSTDEGIPVLIKPLRTARDFVYRYDLLYFIRLIALPCRVNSAFN